MYTKSTKYISYVLLFLLIGVVSASTLFISCKKESGSTTSGKTMLYSYGPMPVARGAELRFIGDNLDKVTAIVLPGNIEIAAASFLSKTATLITITVPQNAVEGLVVVKAPGGDITTKTAIGFSEPISVDNLAPATIKANEVLTITGDYLNLVKQVIFTDRVTADSTTFITQTRSQLTLKVPPTAQTGKISVSNGKTDPIIVFSANILDVKLPVITSFLPNPVKAGTNLTITGTDLDLVKTVALGGNQNITTFSTQTASQIILSVPAITQDDTLRLIPASGVKVKSSGKLVLVVPTVSVTPTTVKNGADITVTGTDLDLIDKVIFGGNKNGTIKAGGTLTQILVTVPDDALSGIVKFTTKAAKEVTGPSLTIVDPVFTSFAPSSSRAKSDIVITGTDLDLVTTVSFVGPVNGTIGNRSVTQMTVTVPVGAKNGKITLVTKNGKLIQSAADLTVLANLPNITSFTEPKGIPGKILTLNGTNMLLIKELIFPGNITATEYGLKTDTQVEVYVPMDVTRGYGQIKLLTYEGEEGLAPQVYFGATDPVKDPALMITDATNPDIPGNWGGNIQVANDPLYALSGNYIHGTASALGGWAWLWGNNWYTFPSVTKSDHLFKMDINLTKPFGTTNVHFQMELGGTRIDLGAMGLTTPTTVGWITVTFDLAAFGDLPATIPSNGEWGINFWYADGPVDITGLYLDNIRYEHK